MNFVFIMTDTQNKEMVGCYGQDQMDTPNLDRLATQGVRFERSYTASPVCTPARGAILSGLHPQICGAWCNDTAPSRRAALMGTILSHFGYRTGYTGKWHLDGTAYFGDGVAAGGFESEWWYDGKRYVDDIGRDAVQVFQNPVSANEVREVGLADENNLWGHRVATRAVDFLENIGQEKFVLFVSFDEPHPPSIAPPAYWEQFENVGLRARPNYAVCPTDKPALSRYHAEGNYPDFRRPDGNIYRPRLFGCNAYIDREIGRVLNAVDRLHADDTVVIYTTDHGDQMGSHCLFGKGPMMYEESCNIPLIVRIPGGPAGHVSRALISHVDLLPTMLELAGIDRPEAPNGHSMVHAMLNPSDSGRDYALISFSRFGISLDAYGEFYPVRCVTDGRHKLVVNLFDSDELYELDSDPFELQNRIADGEYAHERNRLHDWMLAEMERIRDPFRSYRWGDRSWRTVRRMTYHRSETAIRYAPDGFPFQSRTVPRTP